MPKTKTQRIVFGILMSFFMAYGMEVYNIAIRMGYNLTVGQGFSSITYPVFLEALKEAVGMSVIVFIVSNLVGNRAGAAFMAKYCAPDKDNPYFCRVMRQAGTILVMCPLMSLIASILFQVILGGQLLFRLPAIWIGTAMKTSRWPSSGTCSSPRPSSTGYLKNGTAEPIEQSPDNIKRKPPPQHGCS